MARRRDVDHLSAQGMDKRIILTFRVTDDHVILRNKKDIADLPLCGEGFTGARCTEDQAVRVLELFPVDHDHVVGKRIQPVIKGLAFHEKFLCGKGYEDRCRSRCQRAFDGDQVQAKRDAAHQSLFLLIVQPPQYTVVFLCYA